MKQHFFTYLRGENLHIFPNVTKMKTKTFTFDRVVRILISIIIIIIINNAVGVMQHPFFLGDLNEIGVCFIAPL